MKLFLYFLLVMFTCSSCDKNRLVEDVPAIQTPEEIEIDVNGDNEFEFMTSIRRTVADGPGYVAYGTDLTIERANDTAHSLLRGTEFELFLTVGDTIRSEDSSDYFWSVGGITYANKLQESTNNFKIPRTWDLFTEGEETSAIVAYQLQDNQSLPLLGWIKFQINILNGSLDISEISQAVRTDELIIE